MNKTELEQEKINILNLFKELNYPVTNELNLENFFQSFLSRV